MQINLSHIFKNFTNTYDTIPNLKAKYDSALIDNRIVGLSIATRPDCINEDITKLIKVIVITIMYVLNLVYKLQMMIQET